MNKAISIYAIVLDKALYSTMDEAANYAAANDYKTEQKIEDEFCFGFIQREKADFKLNAFGEGQDFKAIRMVEGVVALIGELNEDVVKRDGTFYLPGQEARKTYFLTKVDEAKRIITGPVLVPDVVDLQGDFEFADDIAEAAYKFMEDARNIGEMHVKFGNIGVPVESWIARDPVFVDKGTEFKIYPKGTWMLSVRVTDDKVWEKVRNGELTGFSIGFRGSREEA